jgi:hypothetical protein
VAIQVLTAANMKMMAFWDIAVCSLVVLFTFQMFLLPGATSTRLRGAIAKKAVIFTRK